MTIPLTIKQIEMLVKISEGKGLSEAARLLNLSPSAVSKGLAVMEENLGVPLIQRTTRSFQLTEAGEYFVSRASDLLKEFDDIVNTTCGYFNHPHGALKITCSVAFGYAHLIDIFEEYRKKNHDVELILDLDDHLTNLNENNVDIALRITATPPQNYAARKLSKISWLYCASPDYLARKGSPTKRTELAWWWSLLLIAGLSLVASKGEKLLFKVSGSMIAVKLVIIVAIGFVVIPFWDVSNIGAFPTVSHLVVGTFPTLPFAIFSIMFVGILNPMNIAYKKREEDKDVAKYKILRVHKVAYLVLVATVLLFVMSIVLSISEADALRAYQDNISALALAAKVIPGATVKYMSVILNVFSIVTAFLALYLAVHESFVGLIKVTVEKIVKPQENNSKAISVAAFVMVVLVLWLIVLTNFPILKVFVFGGVTYGLISCIIPGFIILKNDKFSDLRGVSVYYVILIGMLMCIGPFVMLFSQ